MSQHAATAQQGHIYLLSGRKVMAMDVTQEGHTARVSEIDLSKPWPLGREHTVKASWLTPCPMVYYGGQVP